MLTCANPTMVWAGQHVPTCVGDRMASTEPINLRRTLTVNTVMAHGNHPPTRPITAVMMADVDIVTSFSQKIMIIMSHHIITHVSLLHMLVTCQVQKA